MSDQLAYYKDMCENLHEKNINLRKRNVELQDKIKELLSKGNIMGEKPWYKSLTIDAGLVVALLTLLRIFGVNIGDALAESQGIAEAINGALALLASVLIIIGRVKAKDTITP